MASKDWARKISDVPEGTRRQWRADRALRAPMRSPGRPQPSREVQRQFWQVIATGVTTAEASLTVGVSWPVGARWFRHAGGMTPLPLAEPTGRYLSFAEREEIAILHAQGHGVRQIGRALGRDPGTISPPGPGNVVGFAAGVVSGVAMAVPVADTDGDGQKDSVAEMAGDVAEGAWNWIRGR